MDELQKQLTKIVKSSKIFHEDVNTSIDEDRLLGTIDKFLNESVQENVESILTRK